MPRTYKSVHTKIISLFLIVLLSLAPAVGVAAAAEASSDPAGSGSETLDALIAANPQVPEGITPFEAMTFMVRRLPNTYFAAATGFLNPDTPLPATIEIAVPEGSSIIWFGEISGGPITGDTNFDPEDPAIKRTENGFDIYTATLTEHRQAQIEFNLFFSPVIQQDDGTYLLRMEYTPLHNMMALRFITNLPLGSEALTQGFDLLGINEEGEDEFFFDVPDPRAETLYSTTLNYSAPSGRGTPNESRVSDGLLITGGVTVLGLVCVLYFVILTRRRRAAEGYYDEDYEGYEEDE
ncbi:MAG: hypothetical protein FWE51_05715 [Coriobacteriia bacterium]|nr:hypothetical protein [Coriobacteriia bacterium]